MYVYTMYILNVFKEEAIDARFTDKFNEVYMELGGMGERVLG